MMKKIIFIVLAFVAVSLSAQQRNDSTGFMRSSNFYFTLFGDVSYLSVNFEKRYVINPGFFVAGKIGLGFSREISFFNSPVDTYLALPHQISLNLGHRSSFFEIGMGGTYVPYKPYDPYYFLYPFAGYRFQGLNANKLLMRIFVSYPLSGDFLQGLLFIPFGFSIGTVL